VATRDVSELTRASRGQRLEVRITGDVHAAARLLAELQGVASAEARADRVVVWGEGADIAERVSGAVVGAGFGLVELRAGTESLEDAYLRLVKE
jgi:hypothetical protein